MRSDSNWIVYVSFITGKYRTFLLLLTMFWVCKKIFTPSWVAWKKVKLWKTTEFVVIAPSTASRLGFIFI